MLSVEELRAADILPSPYLTITLQVLERGDKLFKAPEPTALQLKSTVRLAFDDNALEGTMRWEYGTVVKVHSGGELLNINLDNGQQLRWTPLYDVSLVESVVVE